MKLGGAKKKTIYKIPRTADCPSVVLSANAILSSNAVETVDTYIYMTFLAYIYMTVKKKLKTWSSLG